MTFDEQLRRAVETLADRLRDEITQQASIAADEIGALTRAERAEADARAYAFGQEAGRIAGLQDGRLTGLQDGDEAVARLADAIRAIDATRSLTSILDLLVTHAAREADRVALLLVRDAKLQRWRLVGFDAALENDPTLEFAIDDADVAGDAVKRNAIVAAAGATEPGRAPAFAASSSWSESVCVPIALGGAVVAVLYADRRDENAPPLWRVRIEMLARHATRSLEALIAFKAARLFTPAGEFTASSDAPDASAEDQTAAQRYARLLVSEIRLYHEDAVAAGRRERDLATRLGGEIARARMLYEQRVTSRVRQRADYFQDELVRTLADGDPALLELRS